MPIQSIPVVLPPSRTYKGRTILTGLLVLLLSGPALGSSSAHAQQSTAKLFGGEILSQQPPLPSLGRYYYPNQLIVSFKKGVNGQQLMKNIATERRESSEDHKDLQLALEPSRDLPALVTLTPPSAEKESTGQLPYMMLEQPGKESGGSLNWLMARLKASDKVEHISRDYVLFSADANTDHINEMLGDGPYKPTKFRANKPAPVRAATLVPNDKFYKLQWHLKLHGDKYADGMPSAFKGGYKFYQGTSQAAPMVAAAAALIKSHNPDFGPDELLATLKKTALPRSKKQCAKACGAGLLHLAVLATQKTGGAAKQR